MSLADGFSLLDAPRCRTKRDAAAYLRKLRDDAWLAAALIATGKLPEDHKHRWTEQYRDKQAYVPGDITAHQSDPVSVWSQFCAEARITHNGTMQDPPKFQGELFA